MTWDLFRDAKRQGSAADEDGGGGDESGGGGAAVDADAAEAEDDANNPDLTEGERVARAAARRERAAKAALEVRSVLVGNVLMGESANRIKFFRMPQTGCYQALRVSYQALLNETTLEAARTSVHPSTPHPLTAAELELS